GIPRSRKFDETPPRPPASAHQQSLNGTCLRLRGWQLDAFMSTLSPDDIKNALKAVKYPGYSRDIVSFGLIKQIAADQGAVSVSMQLTSANAEAAGQIKAESERVLKALPGVKLVHVEVKQPAAAPGATPGPSGPSP